MEIVTAYNTDIGNMRKLNQDSLSVKVVNTPLERIAFAIVCDGMGGLERGELASKELIFAFNKWFATAFVQMVADNSFSVKKLNAQWMMLVNKLNKQLGNYASQKGIMMGTTLSVLLIYKDSFFICHVGDSCIYKIDNSIKKLTIDHTLAAEEVRRGIITEEEALADPGRNILMQCVGASKIVKPQFESGDITGAMTFLLSSDGFIHNITEQEIFENFCPQNMKDRVQMTRVCEEITKLVIERGEKDNVTVVVLTLRNEE